MNNQQTNGWMKTIISCSPGCCLLFSLQANEPFGALSPLPVASCEAAAAAGSCVQQNSSDGPAVSCLLSTKRLAGRPC